MSETSRRFAGDKSREPRESPLILGPELDAPRHQASLAVELAYGDDAAAFFQIFK